MYMHIYLHVWSKNAYSPACASCSSFFTPSWSSPFLLPFLDPFCVFGFPFAFALLDAETFGLDLFFWFFFGQCFGLWCLACFGLCLRFARNFWCRLLCVFRLRFFCLVLFCSFCAVGSIMCWAISQSKLLVFVFYCLWALQTRSWFLHTSHEALVQLGLGRNWVKQKTYVCHHHKKYFLI